MSRTWSQQDPRVGHPNGTCSCSRRRILGPSNGLDVTYDLLVNSLIAELRASQAPS